MANLNGSIDDLGRPLIRLQLPHGHDDLLVIVDTGFNGELMMSLAMAQSLGLSLDDDLVPIELGTGAIERVYTSQIDVLWLDKELRVRALVSTSWPSPAPDAPVALIGTRLLRPHLLLVDFDANTVAIESRD